MAGGSEVLISTTETTQECEANKPTQEKGCGIAGMAGNLLIPSQLGH